MPVHFCNTIKSGYRKRVIFLCGKDVHPLHYRANSTQTLDDVTCILCINALKDENWHCQEHGFIADGNVTFEGTCGICGRPVDNQ